MNLAYTMLLSTKYIPRLQRRRFPLNMVELYIRYSSHTMSIMKSRSFLDNT